jgi:hypothetical protein
VEFVSFGENVPPVALLPGIADMTDEHRMEQLSFAYAQAVAAVCGCRWARPELDYGIDLSLRQVRWQRGRWWEAGIPLDIQLKSEAGATVTPTHVVHDLKAEAYDILRRSTRSSPAILVLLVLPANQTDWIDHSEDRLELRKCAYWLSLRGQPASTNKATVRVHIPRANQFTPAALQRIMEAIRRREDI